MEAHVDRGEPELRARAVAVDHAGESPFGHRVAQDRDGVAVGVPGVDDQRQPARTGGREMGAEDRGLHVSWAVLVVVIQPALADLGYSRGDFPITEAWAEELLSLPMFPELERSEVELVAGAVAAAAVPAR